MKWISVFLSFFLFVSCSSLREKSGDRVGVEPFWASLQEDKSSIDLSLMLAQQQAVDRILNKSKNNIEKKKNQKKSDFSTRYVLDTKSDHPQVRKWIKYYCEEDRERFQRFLNRGVKYKKMVQEIFMSQDLPPDLYYLGLLESGYSRKVVSRAGAVGLWQFMAPTGREYGLKVNNYVDERMDPIRATLAASRYLKELYRQKKSWSLALASYNAGPGRVRKAMRRGSSKNYWSLTRRRLLPYDTREYVPQFLAILYIGKNLKRFNFNEKPVKPLSRLELVKVPSPLKIKQIAKITGLSSEKIQKNNSHLLRKVTPPGAKSYPLWIRPENKQLIVKNHSVLSKHRLKGLKVRRFVSAYGKKRGFHRVRRGQNLSTIARRYKVSVKKLKKINDLKSSRIYVGQKLKLRYGHRGSSSRVYKKKARHYRIRPGDNLHKISKKFGLTVQQIKKINNLRTDKIVYGKYLLVAAKSRK